MLPVRQFIKNDFALNCFAKKCVYTEASGIPQVADGQIEPLKKGGGMMLDPVDICSRCDILRTLFSEVFRILYEAGFGKLR